MLRQAVVLAVVLLCIAGLFPAVRALESGIGPPESGMGPTDVQRHIEEMRRTQPGKYQFMVNRAGGRVPTDCIGCHVELAPENREKKQGRSPVQRAR